jgi:hypothetical protein
MIALVVIIGLTVSAITIYDLLPYKVRNYVTHTGSTSRSYELIFNSSVWNIELEIDPFIDIVDPFPNTNTTYELGSNINVTSVLEFTSPVLYSAISSFLPLPGFHNMNATISSEGVDFSDNSQYLWIHIFNMTDVTCLFSYTADYEVEMIYILQPRIYLWRSIINILSTQGLVVLGVFLFALVLIYTSIRMTRE